MERYFNPSKGTYFEIQVAAAEPVGSIVTDNRRLLEDNGWPNVELRLATGLGSEKKRLGGRKSRPFALGVSGIIGQLRTTGIITSPVEPDSPDRQIVEVQGVGVDVEMAFGKRFGLLGEFYAGHGLGEYTGGVLQSFNNLTFDVISSIGGFGEAYVYILDKLHLHGGYGIDDPENDDLSILQIRSNRTGFGVLYWDISKVVQVSFEADYRKTKYFEPLLTADGMIFMSQMLFRF